LCPAEDDLSVLGKQRDPRKMLYAALQKQAGEHFREREKAVAALDSPAAVARRQQELKARFIQALGGFPERTPLNPQIVGREQRDGYRIEKIIYESQPQHHVTAVLFLPDAPPPFPGVLVPCGHSANGKANDVYQRACISMAKNGMAVLCYDPIGQGERIQLLDPQGKPAIAGSTSEHSMVGVGALLVGRGTATYRIWDGIRSLDYLASRPEVDPQRLGCTGNSGGGTLTAYLMALDDRIQAAAPSCYITSLERLFATIGPQDAEQNITGQVAFGMDHADFVTMRAPRPTLICVGTQDFFDIQGAWTTFREAKLVYGLLGHGERVDLFEFNDKHGFSLPRRQAAMRWMRRWLSKQDDAPLEPDFPVFKDAELQCTRTGQVLADLQGRSVFDLNAAREQELQAQRTKFQKEHSAEELLGEIRRLIAVAAPVPAAKATAAGSLERPGHRIRRFVFTTEPGIEVPGLLFEPSVADAARGPLLISLNGRGMAADAVAGGALESLVKSGRRVLALDLRGMGETAPGTPPANRPDYFGTDSKEAFLSLHLSRPLLGQRVHDVLAVIESLASENPAGFEIQGTAAAAPVALHAAALEPRIKQITLESSLASWRAVVQTPISHNQLSNAVPGALAVYDLPDLAATLAPRPLAIREAVDPQGERLPPNAVEEAFGECRKAYLGAGAGKALQLPLE
jgi:cephalosporin-C deacetylase-like acetyl esterase